jgi:ABC-2 type transport system ATP-binding protein
MTSPAIVAEGLRKAYGQVHALDGLDLMAEEGSVLGVLGPNGAGKTTAVRILTTLLRPDAGSARVAGLDVVTQAGEVRRRIGLAGQYAAVDEDLTGYENLLMFGLLYHLPRSAAAHRARDLLSSFGIEEAAGRLVKTYSGGMRRRLDLAACLIVAPPIVFLDEPTTGLDPRGRQAMWDIIEGLVAGGTTALLTTQYMDEADHLADRIVVVDHGRAIAEGTSEQLKAKVGGQRLDLRLADQGALPSAIQALAPHRSGELTVDGDHRHITVPVTEGAARLAAIVRDLDAAHVVVAELALRGPTLDDVFMTLTGRTATPL